MNGQALISKRRSRGKGERETSNERLGVTRNLAQVGFQNQRKVKHWHDPEAWVFIMGQLLYICLMMVFSPLNHLWSHNPAWNHPPPTKCWLSFRLPEKYCFNKDLILSSREGVTQNGQVQMLDLQTISWHSGAWDGVGVLTLAPSYL